MEVYLPSRKAYVTIQPIDIADIRPSSGEHMIPTHTGSKLTVIGKPGTGKCLARDSQLLMRDGTTVRVQDVQVGMQLMAPDGIHARTVLAVCQGVGTMFTIQGSSQTHMSFTANDEHLCTVFDVDKNIITEVFVNDLFVMQDRSRYRLCLQHGATLPITKITLVGTGDYFGFELDGDGRFVLSNGIITHNTTLISSILYAKRHTIPEALVVSGSEEANQFYEQVLPRSFIYHELHHELVERVEKRQKSVKTNLRINPWLFFLVDDCMDNPSMLRHPAFQRLYKLGRHWKMLFILSLQYAMDVPPYVRACSDGTFILRESIPENRKKLFRSFSSGVDSLADFNALMDTLTENYGAMYIRNQTTSNRLEDCIFFYRPTPPPLPSPEEVVFREVHRGRSWFGSNAYWSFHHSRKDSLHVREMSQQQHLQTSDSDEEHD